MAKHILIADDDQTIADLIGIYLLNEGYEVTKTASGAAALAVIANKPVHLLILDIMMPEMDGLEVCRRIRSEQQLPILMLSAKAEDMDKIVGLMTGADDYMVKPFNPLELMARVKSLLRRAFSMPQAAHQETQQGIVAINGLIVNKHNHSVTVDERPIHLTSIEFGILYLLASNHGHVFSAEDIYEKVWGGSFYQSGNTVMVHISKLRDKLEEASGVKWVQTVWGVGYKIDG